jgi:hypothetical protein
VHSSCSAAPLATLSATDPHPRPQSHRSRPRPPPVRRHWPGCADRLPGARLLCRPCPTGYRIGSSVRTWLSPVMNSAASQPIYAKLIGSRQSPRLLPLYSSLIRQGPFPPPALPGLIGSTSPSAICPDRLRPSRASRCHRHAGRRHPSRLPLLRISRLAHVLSPLPRRNDRVRVSLACPTTAAFLVIMASRLPQRSFEACTVFTLVIARTLRFPPFRGVFLKCFRPFVASWPAPSASGRSESGRVGISPTGLVRLRQGTHNNRLENRIRRVAARAAANAASQSPRGAPASSVAVHTLR